MSFNFCIYFSVSYIWDMIWAFQNIPSFTWIAMAFAFLLMAMAVPDDGQSRNCINEKISGLWKRVG